jgi:hypothetical protein
MISVFGDVGQRRLSRQPTLDQPCRRRGLDRDSLASPAGISGMAHDWLIDKLQIIDRPEGRSNKVKRNSPSRDSVTIETIESSDWRRVRKSRAPPSANRVGS